MINKTIYGIAAGILLMLCGILAQGQTYNFDQSTKEQNIGTYVNNGSYTITFLFLPGNCFAQVNGQTIWFTYGNTFAYSKYYNFTWVTTYLDANHQVVEDKTTFDLSGWWGMGRLKDGKVHRITLTRTSNNKKLIIDSVLIANYNTKPQDGFSSAFWLSTNRNDMKLCGTVSNFVFTPSEINVVTVPQPKGVIDSSQYPIGYDPYTNDYSKIPLPVDQYKMYKPAIWHKKHNCERGSLMIEGLYLSGYKSQAARGFALRSQAEVSQSPRAAEVEYMANSEPLAETSFPQITANGKFLMAKLATDYNFGFRICSNWNSYYSNVIHNSYNFDRIVMDTAKYFPYIRKDIGSALVQTNNIPPYQAADLETVTISTPLSYFTGTRNITYIQCKALDDDCKARGIPDTSFLAVEDNEGMHTLGGGTAGTAAYVRNFNYMLDTNNVLFPKLYQTGYNTYSYWWEANALVFPQNLLGNSKYATPSAYWESPSDWCQENGVNHGLPVLERALYDQINKGYPLFTPFVSPGWSSTIENNMQPAQFSGLCGLLYVLGTPYQYPSYFTTGGNVQDPKTYCYIPALVGKVQASLSNPEYYDIIMNGILMPGTNASILPWDYNQWSGDFETITFARKKGTKYIIGTARMKGNIFKPINGRRRENIPLVLSDGTDLRSSGMYSIARTGLWYLDTSKPIVPGTNPKMISAQVPYNHLTKQYSIVVTNAEDITE